MPRKTGNHERNISGLKQSAQEKREKTVRRCEQAIQKLLRERKDINFSLVARTAKISVAWLYKEQEVRRRIEHLRGTYQPSRSTVPYAERVSDASLRSQNKALKIRNQQLIEEIRLLGERISIAYGIISDNNLAIPNQ